MSRVGEKIADTYLLTELLGKGGMGEVYLAEKVSVVRIGQRELGQGKQKVAVKLAKPGLIDEAGFEREVDIWLAASDEGHPHILPIHHAEKYCDDFLIETKYVANGSLKTLLERGGRLGVAEAVRITDGILAGLSFLHTRPNRIIHRDLKPDNVLMDGDCPLIADFGISRVLKSEDSSISLGFHGTPEYSAPEVFRAGRRNEHGDIWAVGVILYEMLSGVKPFACDGARSPQERIEQVAQKVFGNTPHPLPKKVPERLRAVIAKAMATDSAARYANAEEMRLALGESFVVPSDDKKTIRDESFTSVSRPEFKPSKRNPVALPSKPPAGTGPHYLRWALLILIASISGFAGMQVYQRSGAVSTIEMLNDGASNLPAKSNEVLDSPPQNSGGNMSSASEPERNRQMPTVNSNDSTTPRNSLASKGESPRRKNPFDLSNLRNDRVATDAFPLRKAPETRRVTSATPKPAPSACPENDVDCLMRKARKQ
jgi:serine/threonine protein kinase